MSLQAHGSRCMVPERARPRARGMIKFDNFLFSPEPGKSCSSRELIRLRASKSGGSVSSSTEFSTKKVIFVFKFTKKIKIGI
jgi:hypothetical protein